MTIWSGHSKAAVLSQVSVKGHDCIQAGSCSRVRLAVGSAEQTNRNSGMVVVVFTTLVTVLVE